MGLNHLILKLIVLLFLVSTAGSALKAQALVAHAGSTALVCDSGSATIGGTPAATGGKLPYTYSWTPSSGLSSTSVSNPVATIGASPTMTYTLTVTDSAGTTSSSTVTVSYYSMWYAHAGSAQSFCGGVGLSATIGAGNPTAGPTYSWSPATGLSSTTSPSPVATPTVTTTYTMTVDQGTCPPHQETVTVTIHQPPPVSAGHWTVIFIGEKTTLHGSGASVYSWSPSGSINYNGSANPDAEPLLTTTYTVQAKDSYGCVGQDTVTVFVIQDNSVIIYNTFTPNGDGNNDTWYIGNILSFPNCKLDIYNRYGKLVYTKVGYMNDWDGTNQGEKLPDATYYYKLDLGDGSNPYKGSVSIIR